MGIGLLYMVGSAITTAIARYVNSQYFYNNLKWPLFVVLTQTTGRVEELAEMCSNLVESMPKRVEMLVKAKGAGISLMKYINSHTDMFL